VAESFVLVEMAIELQEEFHVRLLQEDLNGVRTVADLTRLVASRAVAAG
jgi:acyl carrier protein